MVGSTRRKTDVSLSLLNGFILKLDEQEVALQPAARRVLAFLALKRRPVQRAFVAGTLWPEADDSHASANLRTALWRIPDRSVVVSDQNCLTLDARVVVDARRAIARARGVLDGREVDDGAEDEELLFNDLLPDWWEEWLVPERERFRQLRIHALERMGQQSLAAGRVDRAIDMGLAAIAAEPLRESGHRLVIRAHLAEGNYVEALRQYRTCAGLLADELGVAPSHLMRELLEVPGPHGTRALQLVREPTSAGQEARNGERFTVRSGHR